MIVYQTPYLFLAGQERYHSLAPMYYRGAQAAIVVYDITNQVFLYSLFPYHFYAGVLRKSQKLDQRVAAPSQPEHRHCSFWKQGRFGRKACCRIRGEF